MVAMAILAMAVTSLLIVRNNAVKDAIKAGELRKMAILLQQKMGEVAVGLEKGSGGAFSEEGYRNYSWQVSTRMQPVSLQSDNLQHRVMLKEVTLVVKDSEGKCSQSIVGYFFTESPEDADEETPPKK
jgi:hypothetical protein